MLKRERLDQIMIAVTKQGYVSVADLAKALNVSEMTIRRDLDELSKSGKVIRLHGGVQAISSQNQIEQNFQEKREIHIQEKQEIAKVAASLVNDNETNHLCRPGNHAGIYGRMLKSGESANRDQFTADF